ncbi:unnamed protein product, partial [Lota lota]
MNSPGASARDRLDLPNPYHNHLPSFTPNLNRPSSHTGMVGITPAPDQGPVGVGPSLGGPGALSQNPNLQDILVRARFSTETRGAPSPHQGHFRQLAVILNRHASTSSPIPQNITIH